MAGPGSPSHGFLNAAKLAKLVAAACGAAFRVPRTWTRVLQRLQHLFFLNATQDVSRFLVTDLGVVRYPEYRVVRTRPVFASRAALDAYELAMEEALQVCDRKS